MAFEALQVSVGVVPTPVAPLVGEGDVGVPGSGTLAAVANDQVGPVVVPVLFRATTCQKYVVPAASAPGEYDDADCAVETRGGGLVVPKRTSKLVAPVADQLNVVETLTPVAPFVGLGAFGAAGAPGF